MLVLSLSNNQITETSTNEYVFGLGYRVNDLKFRFISGMNKQKVSSNLI